MRLFIDLVQVALGKKDQLSYTPSPTKWVAMYDMARKQGVAGILMPALEVLRLKGQTPPKDLLLEWIGVCEQIKTNNRLINTRAVELTNIFRGMGFRTCILKGQGTSLLYNVPLLRLPGDIDIWVDSEKGRIRELVKKQFPEASECAWHIDYPLFNDVPVEVHYTPSYSRHPLYDKRLQIYFESNRIEQFSNYVELPENAGIVSIPTWNFNVIQQLSHIMRHFFVEGIGLRHIIDFYFLLMSYDKSDNRDMTPLLNYLGMYRFATALMWVLYEILGINEKCLISPKDKKRGKLFFEEVMIGGNWGRYDKRLFGRGRNSQGIIPYMAHTMRLMHCFPEEALLTPIIKKCLIK